MNRGLLVKSGIALSRSLTFGAVALLATGAYAQNKTVLTTYGKQAVQESLTPIHPGEPGKQPFWNIYSKQFIYAPAFDYKVVSGATQYRYDITAADSSKYSFKSKVPYAALSPIWAQMPVGTFNLTVTGISAQGKDVATAGKGSYYHAAPFNGIYHTAVMPYDKSAMTALDNLLDKDYVNYWLVNQKPDPSYEYYRYPAKIMGALIVGAVTQARLKAGTPDAQKFTKLATTVADYLISISFKPGTPLEYFPPTYNGYTEKFKKSNPNIKTDDDLTISGADGGNAYLDLYDLTKDQKYLDAAKRIAKTYAKTQLDNGSWYLFVNINTGKATAPNIAIPTAMINFFDRLKRDYKVMGYDAVTQKALKWIMENPVKTFDWQGQFEDIYARPAYKNQSREQACDMAIYLLKNGKSNPANIKLAEELIRYAEDQFVIWEKPVPVPGSETKSAVKQPSNWITPTVQEQFVYWMPVGRAACVMMETYRQAYAATGNDMYMAKAKSLANTFTVVQKENNGEYTTMFSKYKSTLWLNSVVYPAKMMMLLQNNLNTLQAKTKQ